MVGKILAERYEIIEKIAEGGMARVYCGRDLLLKRTVAIKVLKDQMTGDAAFIRRFEREAQSAAALSHPNIVNIYDVGEEDGTYFMVMEYVEGLNLKQYIREKGQLPADEAVSIARQIAEALEKAHSAGVVHRDIKPQNILFFSGGKVKVTDFGIAIAGDGVTVTAGDEIIGTVQYISPEQAKGELADKQSDLYSLGIVLYEMVTGKVPFGGENPVAVAMKHIRDQIIPPRVLREDLPLALEQIIMKAVEKDKANRYESAAEILEDFKHAGKDQLPSNSNQRKPVSLNIGEEADVIKRPVTAAANRNNFTVPPKIRRNWAKPLFTILLLLLILAVGGYILSSFILVPEVVVPKVGDQSQGDAVQILKEAGLVPNEEIYYIYDETILVGNVVKTEPPEGRVVRKNRMIDLYISKGPEFIVTPDLFGRTEMEARVILSDLELNMSVVLEYNEEIDEGFIYLQVPSESFRISRGEEVVVYISRGRGPFELANLIGYSEAGAIEYLEENDLRPRVRYIFTIGSTGHVMEQIPEPGEEVIPGQFVDIIVGE